MRKSLILSDSGDESTSESKNVVSSVFLDEVDETPNDEWYEEDGFVVNLPASEVKKSRTGIGENLSAEISSSNIIDGKRKRTITQVASTTLAKNRECVDEFDDTDYEDLKDIPSDEECDDEDDEEYEEEDDEDDEDDDEEDDEEEDDEEEVTFV